MKRMSGVIYNLLEHSLRITHVTVLLRSLNVDQVLDQQLIRPEEQEEEVAEDKKHFFWMH
jgi:hypothetical protein